MSSRFFLSFSLNFLHLVWWKLLFFLWLFARSFVPGFLGFDGSCFRGIGFEEESPQYPTLDFLLLWQMFLSKLKTLRLFPLPIIGENDQIEKKKLIRLIHYAFILFCFLLLFLLMNTWQCFSGN